MNIKKELTILLIGILVLILFLTQITVAFAEEKEESYERVIAHGGGAYKGFETSNSVEAVNAAIQNGYKIIELDMALSADQKIIMLHDWDRTAANYYGTNFSRKITQRKFLNLTVYDELEVLTFEKLAKIMEKNQDVNIVTDVKENNLELLTKISEEYPNLVKRIIPQIYDYDQWSKVKALGYADIIFTLYAMPQLDLQKLISFVNENGVYAVTMPDYLAEKGLCSQLSKKGIKVYVHPVSLFEDAQQWMNQGAYGVYSGTLLPEEFKGFEKDYYLSTADGNGTIVKLADAKIDNLQELQMHGLKTGDSVAYYVDETRQSFNQEAFAKLESGKHKLTVQVYNKEKLQGSLVYFLWKSTDDCRIVHKKFEYRLDEEKQEKGFNSVMEEGNISAQIVEILKNSLIAKNGECLFYNNGNAEKYKNGEEFLPVKKGSYGKLLLPLNASIKELGATSVSMGQTKDISIAYNDSKYLVMVDSYFIRKGFQSTKISYPVVLYLNKAMAAGEFYQCITGRSYLENENMIIILPKGVSLNKSEKEKILRAADMLYSPVL